MGKEAALKETWKLGTILLMALVIVGCEWTAGEKRATNGSRCKGPDDEYAALLPSSLASAIQDGRLPVDSQPDTRFHGYKAVSQKRPDSYHELAFKHVDEPTVDHLGAARKHIQSGDTTSAMFELSKALYDDPDNFQAAYLLGKVAWKSGDKQSARKALKLAIETHPDRLEGWIQLGRLALSEGKLDQAAKMARKGMSIDPNRPEPYNLQGRVWLARSHWHKAIVAFERAVSLDPQNRFYLNNLGYAFLLKRDFGKAVEILSRVAQDIRVPAYMLNNLGLAFEGTGRLQEAVSVFQQALEKNPQYLNAQINLDRLATLAKRSDNQEHSAQDENLELSLNDSKESSDLILVEPN